MAASTPNRGPRFVFVTDGVSAGPARFGWRLDAANNRPLGRGVGTFGNLEDCTAWLDAFRSDHAGGTGLGATVSFDSVRGLWSWRITRDSRLCAVTVRTYLRRFECRRAVAHFGQALGDITPGAGVVRLMRPEILDRYELGDTAGGAAVAS